MPRGDKSRCKPCWPSCSLARLVNAWNVAKASVELHRVCRTPSKRQAISRLIVVESTNETGDRSGYRTSWGRVGLKWSRSDIFITRCWPSWNMRSINTVLWKKSFLLTEEKHNHSLQLLVFENKKPNSVRCFPSSLHYVHCDRPKTSCGVYCAFLEKIALCYDRPACTRALQHAIRTTLNLNPQIIVYWLGRVK